MMSTFPSRGMFAWMSALAGRSPEQSMYEQQLHSAIELVVDVADSDIRRVRKYQKKLRPAVETAMEYSMRLVEHLPGPIPLSRRSYHADPLVKAVFVSADQMVEILRLSLHTRASEGPETGSQRTALLSMLRTERTVYGRREQGGMMQADVAQQTVNFEDHRVVALAPDLAATREKLHARALEVLATLAMEKIMTIRGDIASLRERKVYLQSMRKILKGRRHTMDMLAYHSHENSRKIEQIEQQLLDLEVELESALGQRANPGDSLTILAGILEGAGTALTLQEYDFRVDWKNVLLDDGQDTMEGNDISLAELSAGDELQRWAMLVSFRPDEVMS